MEDFKNPIEEEKVNGYAKSKLLPFQLKKKRYEQKNYKVAN